MSQVFAISVAAGTIWRLWEFTDSGTVAAYRPDPTVPKNGRGRDQRPWPAEIGPSPCTGASGVRYNARPRISASSSVVRGIGLAAMLLAR